jgi:hypothetical protein
MINFIAITKAIESILKEANVNAKSYTIERNTIINTDENIAFEGWIGIYRGSVRYTPYTTGSQPYLAEIDLRIEVQAASLSSAQDCEAKLDELVDFVLGSLDNNRNLGGVVAMVKGYEVDYDDNYAEGSDIFYQTAEINPIYEVRA